MAVVAASGAGFVCTSAHADPTVLDHWALGTNNSGTFTDSGPDAINASVTLVNGATGTASVTTTGPSGSNPFGASAAVFGGAGSYLSLATNPFAPLIDTSYPAGSGMYSATGNSDTVQAMNGAFTLAAWVNVPATVADGGNTFFGDWGPDVANGSGQYTNNHASWFSINGGHPRMQLRQTIISNNGETKTDLVAFQSTNAITAGTWNQVTFVWDPTNATTPGTIYVTPMGGSSASYTGPWRNGGSPTNADVAYFNAPSTQIGLKGDDSGNAGKGYGTFTGDLQNVWLFSGALSATQVSNLVATNSIVPEPAPAALLGLGILGTLLLVRRRRNVSVSA
jgi:hypothetical protein